MTTEKIIIASEEALMALIDQRIDERRRGRRVAIEILDGYDKALEKFNFVDTWNTFVNIQWKLRAALNTIIQAHFKIRRTHQLKESMRDEAKALIEKIIAAIQPTE